MTHVIRGADATTIDVDGDRWDEKSINAIQPSGPEYNLDKQIIHAIILRNEAQDSGACTYIKYNIRRANGRLDTTFALKLTRAFGKGVTTRWNPRTRSFLLASF